MREQEAEGRFRKQLPKANTNRWEGGWGQGLTVKKTAGGPLGWERLDTEELTAIPKRGRVPPPPNEAASLGVGPWPLVACNGYRQL